MAECDVCGKDENMPYECKRCGGTFCVEHRLPEGHDCPALNAWSGGDSGGGALGGASPGSTSQPQTSGTIGGTGGRSRGGLTSKLPFDTGQTGLAGYFRNNLTFVFLLAMWLTFATQLLLRATGEGGPFGLEYYLFVVESYRFWDVWTWLTSVFAHGGFGHIALNSIALYFFGPIVERKLGSRRFAALFLGAGVLASVGSVGISILIGDVYAGLGASGAILAILGVLTILNPELRVMLLIPPIPMPLWVLTAGIAAISIFFIAGGSPGAFGIGHAAHLAGLLVGLAYGQKLKRDGMSAPRQMQMGGGPGGPGGGLGGRRRF